jgi:hypothetical protein
MAKVDICPLNKKMCSEILALHQALMFPTPLETMAQAML